ncbi:MAG TPA: SAM-dependent chlorinase/fluorinase [Burkholderiales bacterium]|nr:SAM-dependent chlorinase/fluorinase [Burkholderiales bacterium]
MIVLFTDFGGADPYVGQAKAVLHARAPRIPLIDALHDVPTFGIEPAAHLLAALAPHYPRGSVFIAVVDPGVGGAREAVVVQADGRRFVGPDNGLMSLVWQRAARRACWRIAWRPARLSASFHARDLFAPVASKLALGRAPRGWLLRQRAPKVLLDARDLARVIYIDHYGNAMTGLRAAGIARTARLSVAGRRLARAATFCDARPGAAFWYENSIGLVEIAANGASAARKLGLRVGTAVRV